ncbi:MAG: RNA polymerase sigma factor [Myxococcaceae bacterium]
MNARANSGENVAGLYRRYGPVIYSRCRRILRDDAAAADLTQEVFLRVLRQLRSMPLDDLEALRWIYRISTNLCLNHRRDEAFRARAILPLDEGCAPSLEAEAVNKDLVARTLSRIPERLRKPGVMVMVDEKPHLAVAEALGISRRTVVNRVSEFGRRARLYVARQ